MCLLVLSLSIFVELFFFFLLLSSRAKHRSDPGGSGRGHQWDCKALPQAREGGERRQSRQAQTCTSIIHHKWGKKQPSAPVAPAPLSNCSACIIVQI